MMGNRMNVFGKGQGLNGDKTTTGSTCISSLPQAAHEGRGLLRQGDLTTPCPQCGEVGKIIEGEQRMKFHDLPVAVDGMLVHCGCPSGSNRLIAPLGKLSDSRIAATTNPTGQTSPAARPVPQSNTTQVFYAPPGSQPSLSATTGTLEPGFYIVPRSMSGAQVLNQLGPEHGPQLIARLHRLNPTFSTGFKAGEIFVIGDPDNTSACTREEAELMAAAAQAREALASLSEDEADFMMRHQAEIAGLLDHASQSMGVGTVMLGRGLEQTQTTLKAIELLHQREFSLHGDLKSPEFFASRSQLRQQLDAHLKSAFLNKQLSLGSHEPLRKSLGISTRSLVHHWKRAGAPGQIPGYATHLESVARTARYLKYGGYVGIGIGGVSSWLKVEEVCRAGETEACKKIRFTEIGSFSVGLAGGAAGAYAGTKTAALVCGSFGPVGFAVCGIVLVGAGSLAGGLGGNFGGEQTGDFIYEMTRP